MVQGTQPLNTSDITAILEQLHTNAPKEHEPKVAFIDKFHGNPERVQPFLTDLRTRFMLQPRSHALDHVKVFTAISHMEGSAKAWANPILDGHRDHLLNYTAFVEAFQTQFGDPNLHDTLIEKLRHLRQTTSVLNYANNFENLAYQINWPSQV